VIGRAAGQRAIQTYLDAEAVLPACERLRLPAPRGDVLAGKNRYQYDSGGRG
jgi:hypothetical protein